MAGSFQDEDRPFGWQDPRAWDAYARWMFENELLETPLNSEWGYDGVVGRDWTGGQADAAERLALYRQHVERVLAGLPPLLGVALTDTGAWAAMRAPSSAMAPQSSGTSPTAS
mgnify:CR=1 FL=1